MPHGRRVEKVDTENHRVDGGAIHLVVDERRARRSVGIVRAEAPPYDAQKPGIRGPEVLDDFESNVGESHEDDGGPAALARRARGEYIDDELRWSETRSQRS